MTLESAPLAKPTPSRRSWRRFSLRSYLVFMTLAGCFFGWVAKERRQSEFERKAGRKLEEQGVPVLYYGPYDSLEVYQQEKPQGWWRYVKPQGWWRYVTGKVLGERVGAVNDVSARITDVTPLAGLENLESLALDGDSITDLTPLAELKNLRWLVLKDKSITDVTPLAGLENLEQMYLEGDSITDLTPLAELKNLELLGLCGESITDEQIKSLQKALPSCFISR